MSARRKSTTTKSAVVKPSHPKSPRWVSYTFLLINVICWSAALIVVKPALEFTTPFRFLLYRYVLAVVLSIPLLIYYWPRVKKPFTTFKTIVPLELLGTTLTLSLLYIGLARTSAIEASLIATATPLFITIMGVLLLREKQQLHETLGVLLAFAGTILLTIIPMLNQGGSYQLSLVGNLLIVAQNTTAAFYYVYAKRYYAKLPKLFVTTISFYVGLISFLLISLMEIPASSSTHLTLVSRFGELVEIVRNDFQHISVWVASVYMALFGSIIGLTAYIKGQDGIEASEASVFWYLEPMVYLPLAVLLLGEKVMPLQLVALLIIFVGVFVAERRTQSTAQTTPLQAKYKQ